jgi:hypothetical protein
MNLTSLNTANKTASEPEENFTSVCIVSGSTFCMKRVLAPFSVDTSQLYHKTVMNVFDCLQKTLRRSVPILP